MTLEEAIDHAETVANAPCNECAAEHRQLAGWLKELRELRGLRAGLMQVRVPCPVMGCGGQLSVVFNEQGYFLKCNHYDYCIPLSTNAPAENKKVTLENAPSGSATHAELTHSKHRKLRPDEDPVCPCCGSKLKVVSGKYGDFWGCSGYPKCQYSRNISSTYDAERPAIVGHKHATDYRFPQEKEHIRVSDNVDIDEDFEAYGSALPEDVYGEPE